VAAAGTASAAERLFVADVEGGRFSAGVDRGYWRLVKLDWPHAIIEVAYPACPGGWLVLRFHLAGYPQAPTAQPWDLENGMALPGPRWPQGSARVNRAFNPNWRPDALYIPTDRLALEGHDSWRSQCAAHVWDQSKDICQYLELVRDLLKDAV
jgi:hypothetical protein